MPLPHQSVSLANYRLAPALLALLTSMAAVGCGGSSGIPLAPVTGTVTFYGRPVVAELLFQPATPDGTPRGRASTAMSDSNGQFTLQFSDSEWGAMLGTHRVLVKVLPFADSGEPEILYDATLPIKVAELRRNVRSGRNRLDFALTY